MGNAVREKPVMRSGVHPMFFLFEGGRIMAGWGWMRPGPWMELSWLPGSTDCPMERVDFEHRVEQMVQLIEEM